MSEDALRSTFLEIFSTIENSLSCGNAQSFQNYFLFQIIEQNFS